MKAIRFGAYSHSGLRALASFSLMAAIACGGVAGCGGGTSTSNPADGGDAGDGSEQAGDAVASDSAEEPGEDASEDAPSDGGTEASDGGSSDAPTDAVTDGNATGDSPSEATETTDAPGDDAGDAPSEGSTVGSIDAAGSDSGADATLSPSAVFATTTIDAGAGNCGSATGVTATFSVQNAGTAPLTVTATIGGTVFSASPTMLNVAAGTSGMITITAVVPASATAGSAISGSMAVTTNDPAHATAAIPLSVTPTGATLAWAQSSLTTANFGVQPENQAAAPIALTLANTGNAGATVAFGTPTDPQFSLSQTTGTSGSIGAGGTLGLTAGFTPNTTTLSNATSSFTVTGVVCGTSLTSLSFSGQGGVGDVTGWPTGTVDFQGNPCGGAAAPTQSFTLSNSGGIAAHITSVTFASYPGYTSSAAAGATIPAGGTLKVTLGAPAIPYPSAVPGNYGATVTYTTDVAGDTPHQVTLTEHALGAILAYDTTATLNFGNFNSVPANTSANQTFNVVNSGNAISSVTLSAASPFSLAPTGPFNLSGTSNQSETATFAPLTYGTFSSAVHVIGTNLCQPAPADLPLTGTGQAGGISLSTQSLGFTVNCGATAATQQIVITNTGNTTMTWNAQLPNGTATDSLYSFAPATAMVAAGLTSTITVTPAAMPQYPTSTSPSSFADTITITTDIPNDTGHPVALSETPLGDVLSVQPTSLPFGSIPISTSAPAQTFVVVNGANTGSPTANVTLTPSDPTDFPMSATTATAAPQGQSSAISVQFNAPATPAAYTSNIDLSTTDVLCAPLPANPAVTATGTATQAGPVITPSALNFQLVNCGSAASPAQIVAGNSGTQSYTITSLVLGKGASSYFTVAMVPASGIVTTTGSVTITVTPLAIPSTHTPLPDSTTFSDVLTINTNANVTNPNTQVPLTMGAQGIIITNNLASANWAFGTVNFGSTGFYNNLITNSGNEAAQVTLTGTNYPSIFGLQGQPVSVPNGSVTLSGTFTPPSGTGTWADDATLTVAAPSGSVFCEPLPTSWQTPSISLSGTAGNSPVVSISPTSLPFPSANCGGTTPVGQGVTITNNGSASQAFTAVLGSTGTATGTYYSITSATPNPVPGNGTSTVTVTPTVNMAAGAGAAVGSSPYNDELIITVGATQYDVPITMTVNGVVLSLNNGLGDGVTGSTGTAGSCVRFSYDYYAQVNGTTPGASYSPAVTNSGNVSGAVTAAFSGWSAGDFTSTPTSATINAGASQTFSLADGDPGAALLCNGLRGWYSGTMTFSSPKSCNAPVTVSIAGHYAP
jgi:collagen type VII alpha